MLRELRIENLALIDALHLEFPGKSEKPDSDASGLIVLTGETGSGKSIILQALHLLTGGRGSAAWIRSDCDRAEIEALFEVDDDQQQVRERLRELDLENGNSVIIRRIFSRTGRSRIYINSRMATARLAAELTRNLINIAGQHEHQQLLDPRRHLDFIDSVGELWQQRHEFSSLYRRWRLLVDEMDELQRSEREKEQRRDFLEFQVREIREVDIRPEEDGSLAEERDRLKAADTLISLAARSHDLLGGAVRDNLVQVLKNLEQAEIHDRKVRELSSRAASLCFESEDLAAAIRDYRDSLPLDSGRLDEIGHRLTQLRQLQRKYGPTLEEVIDFAQNAEKELSRLENMEQQLERLAEKRQGLEQELLKAAEALSEKRRRVAGRLSRLLQDELRSLQFMQARFEVWFKNDNHRREMADLQASGGDQVEFMFSANPGEELKPLSRVVSGGELSRLMLAMKCLLARRDQVETVVFDEVDAGISGKAAEAVAEKIRELAGHHQVFCITHLPQIAALADQHFRVGKQVRSGRTRTMISRLKGEERVAELAVMLAGESVTSQTTAYARELLDRR